MLWRTALYLSIPFQHVSSTTNSTKNSQIKYFPDAHSHSTNSLCTLYSHVLHTNRNHVHIDVFRHLFFHQGLRKSESSTDKMQHLLKVRDQSIQNQHQEIAVGALTQNNDQLNCAILLPILLHYQQPLSDLEHALPSVYKYCCWRAFIFLPLYLHRTSRRRQRSSGNWSRLWRGSGTVTGRMLLKPSRVASHRCV